MHLPDEAPRISKLPFLIGDGLLLATAAIIARQSGTPLTLGPLLAIVGCVGLGAGLVAVPYLLEYARKQDALLTERQNSLEALARTTASAAEQISIAAAGLHTIAELAHKNLRAAEQLPQKLHESINEFHQVRDEAVVAENESLTEEINTLRASEAERLDSAAGRVHQTAAELGKMEQSLQRLLSELKATLADRATQGGALAQSNSPSAAAPDAPARNATPTASKPPPPSETDSPTAPSPSSGGSIEPRPAAQARSRSKKVKIAESGPPFDPGPGLLNGDQAVIVPGDEFLPLLEEPSSPATPATEVDAQPVQRTASTDGATSLVATAYIGIGNRLYVRGEGPGLSWDKGVPLRFISIGKWRWETTEAVGPLTVKLYKNDEIECVTLGTIRIDPGQQAEVAASF